MTHRFVAVNPLVEPRWDDLVSAHPEATFFHTAAWARVLFSSYGCTPVYLVAEKDGRLEGMIPFVEIRSRLTGKRGVSLPFTDHCDFLLPKEERSEDVVRIVADTAMARGWETFELRSRVPVMEGIPACAEYYEHELNLSPGDRPVFSRFRENVRRNIRKAEKMGVEVENAESPDRLRQFYRLNCLTRREHGIPPQPFRFFEKLGEHVLSKGKGTLLLARHRGEWIAGAVFLHLGKRVIFKYGASDMRFQHLRANNLVMREAIRHYIAGGFHSLSFGRTDTHHEGLRNFKLSWGCAENVLRYHRFHLKTGSWSGKGKPSRFPWRYLFSRMPVPVLRAIGAVAYSHIG